MHKIRLKTPEEIEILAQGGQILSTILGLLAEKIQPGITTKEVDELARKLFQEYEVEPSFLNYGQPAYPASICISLNDTVVHGIPSYRVIKAGDIVGLDAGIWYKKLCTDMAITVGVGQISVEAKKLIKVTKHCLELGLAEIVPGKRLGDVGAAIAEYAEKNGFSVVRDLTGHGVGYAVHEAPAIPNFGVRGSGVILEANMVLAIEPMINTGHWSVKVLANDWDIVTEDGSLSGHFEQTIAVTKTGYKILTPWPKNLPII